MTLFKLLHFLYPTDYLRAATLPFIIFRNEPEKGLNN